MNKSWELILLNIKDIYQFGVTNSIDIPKAASDNLSSFFFQNTQIVFIFSFIIFVSIE